MKPRPFLKWAGGKTQLLPELLKRIPSTWNPQTDLYVEPFVGAGALFWELQPEHALLGDALDILIVTWTAIKFCLPSVLAGLRALAESYKREPKATYYEVRDEFNAQGLVCMPAAKLIFFNKTGFNGLYRTNSQGAFNVPWGKDPNAGIVDEGNLTACSDFLRRIDLNVVGGDFVEVINSCDTASLSGSLVYCDPPYIPVSKTSNFTSYTADGFTYADQLRLIQYAVWLRDQGAHVILSHAADEVLIENYRRCGFKCDLVSARRAINSKGSKRGPVGEYIIHG